VKTLTEPEHLHFPGLKPWMIHVLALLIVFILAAAVLVSRIDSRSLDRGPMAPVLQ
jgi:hypothetical protein